MMDTNHLNAPFHPSEELSEDQLFSIRDLWVGVRSRPYVVVIALVLGVIGGLYKASEPRHYTSFATISIQPAHGSALELSASQALSGRAPDDETINTELTIMQGRAILLKVAQDLQLANNPQFWGEKKAPQMVMSDPAARDKIMKRMAKILVFSHQPKSDIVQIGCTTSSPLLSSQIPNSITNEFIARIFQVRYGSTERVSSWLVGQLNGLRDQVQKDQTQLVDLQDKLGVLGLDQKNSDYLLADSLEGITKASSEAIIERIVAEAKLRALSDSDPNLIESEQPPLQGSMPQAGLLQTLRASQADAAATYANLSAKFGPAYPDVKQAKARLDEINKAVKTEQARIINQAKASYSAAVSNEEMTSNTLNTLKAKAFESHDDMVRYVILQRQYEADRVLYESLVQRLRVASINAGLESAQVDIVDLADISSIARKPLPYQWFLIIVLGSLIVGCLMAIAIDRLDTRLHKPEDAERLLNLPLLSVLQEFKLEATGQAFKELLSGPYAEGQQLLRNSVLMSRPDSPPNSILLTSAFPGEGKSTVTRGLAAMLAMHNSRVVLVEADLHRPTQSAALKIKPRRGLSEVLTSSLDPLEVIIPVEGVEGLFLLPAGKTPPQPATLLSSSKMRETVDLLKSQFDFVVIDSPPVLRVSDTLLCVSLVEAVVVVVRENVADIKALRQTLNLLNRARANVIGFVMNGLTHKGAGYDSYYADYGNYNPNPETGDQA